MQGGHERSALFLPIVRLEHLLSREFPFQTIAVRPFT